MIAAMLAAAALATPAPHHGPPLLISAAPTRKVAREAERIGRETAGLNGGAAWSIPTYWHTPGREAWRALLRVSAGAGYHCDAVLLIRRERVLDTHGRLVRKTRRMTVQHVRPVGCHPDV